MLSETHMLRSTASRLVIAAAGANAAVCAAASAGAGVSASKDPAPAVESHFRRDICVASLLPASFIETLRLLMAYTHWRATAPSCHRRP